MLPFNNDQNTNFYKVPKKNLKMGFDSLYTNLPNLYDMFVSYFCDIIKRRRYPHEMLRPIKKWKYVADFKKSMYYLWNQTSLKLVSACCMYVTNIKVAGMQCHSVWIKS